MEISTVIFPAILSPLRSFPSVVLWTSTSAQGRVALAILEALMVSSAFAEYRTAFSLPDIPVAIPRPTSPEAAIMKS